MTDIGQHAWNDAFRNASTPVDRVAVVVQALLDYAVDGSHDLLAGLSIPGGLQLTVGDLHGVLATAQNGPLPLWARVPALSTAEMCREAYAAVLAARTDLQDCERAHFQATNGRPA